MAMLDDAVIAWRIANNDDDAARSDIEARAQVIRSQSAEEVSPAQLRQQCHIVAKQLTRLVRPTFT